MKTLGSIESELKDVKNNQKKIILQQNVLKHNLSAACTENASSLLPAMEYLSTVLVFQYNSSTIF